MRYILSLLTIVLALSFSSCGGDKEEPITLSPANARGTYVYYDDVIEKYDCYLWVNDYGIYAYDAWTGSSECNLKDYTNRGIQYYPLDMETVYELLSEAYCTEINADTDLSQFYPNPTNFIKYVKNNKSKYRYIAESSGDFILFNRTSNVNYE